ncbi:class I SAM-dependent methyltransferase [Candidatus Acetothermia bacterium]|jgi:SAM-dependent methyltransferase|nr:class I SAM-dependent methyltransferase [Candidatus Acetothermia bacterium]
MGNKLVKSITTCRSCDFQKLTPILHLGDLYVSNFIDAPTPDEEKYPLEMMLCDQSASGCGLLQLKHTVSPEALYRNYWYRSGMNQTMTKELHSIAGKAETLAKLSANDLVLDIGCNDGTLLRGYCFPKLKLIGFEPARNLIAESSMGTTKIINDFFSFEHWQREFGDTKAKVITAIAMFYDLDDPNTFVADVVKCLADDGIFIIQMSYLPSMLENNAFDNICHEHLEYYSLLSLENLLTQHNLEVFDVELNDINGGSFRTYIRHRNGSYENLPEGATKRVKKVRSFEQNLGLHSKKIYDDFARSVNIIREKLYTFIKGEVSEGKTVYVYGASTKGNTLLQFCNLDYRLIKGAAEKNPAKWGRKTIGTLIPIISEEQARKEKPDYFLILPWHFLEEFLQREASYLHSGGKFIVPLPEFRILSAADL